MKYKEKKDWKTLHTHTNKYNIYVYSIVIYYSKKLCSDKKNSCHFIVHILEHFKYMTCH